MRSHLILFAGLFAAMLVLVAGSGVARAVPTQLTRSEFVALTLTNPTTQVEDFDSFSAGPVANPLTFLNGTATFDVGQILVTDGPCASSGRCIAGNMGTGARTFSFLPANTQLWGTDFEAFTATDAFDVTVVGTSGTLSLTGIVGSTFFGFQDPAGLISVAFENQIGSNYSFDDVTTAVIPEPSTALLVGLGLMGIGGRRREASVSG